MSDKRLEKIFVVFRFTVHKSGSNIYTGGGLA